MNFDEFIDIIENTANDIHIHDNIIISFKKNLSKNSM